MTNNKISDNPAPFPGYFIVARIGAPYGVEGELGLISYSGEYTHLMQCASARLIPGNTSMQKLINSGKDTPKELELPLRTIVARGTRYYIQFEGYNSPEMAAELTGFVWLLPRDKACQLSQDQYYIEDLIGCRLFFQNEPVATILSILEGGNSSWLEVACQKGKVVFVPFRNEFIGSVQISTGEVQLLEKWILDL